MSVISEINGSTPSDPRIGVNAGAKGRGVKRGPMGPIHPI